MPNVDLQSVSIDPTKPQIKKGEQVSIVINMKNNGPDPLPKGEAKVHITLSKKFLYKPSIFRGKGWKLETIQTLANTYELFAVNSSAMPVNEAGFPGFRFSVRGKLAGRADITLASTLSATATSSDVDGANQSVSCILIVK